MSASSPSPSTPQPVWLKGWFDGDYSVTEGTPGHFHDDIKRSSILILRGELSKLEYIATLPDFSPTPLWQREVPEVVLLGDDGTKWLTVLHDFHMPDWQSESTGGAMRGRFQRVGRLVGPAYAKVVIPAGTSEVIANLPVATGSAAIHPETHQTPQAQLEPAIEHTDLTAATAPCEVCGWFWPLVLGALVWWLCGWPWAMAAAVPYLLRCFLSRLPWRPWSLSRERWISTFWLVIGVSAFCWWLASNGLDCWSYSNATLLSLALLAVAMAASGRLVHCWVSCVLSLLWAAALLCNCHFQPSACETHPRTFFEDISEEIGRLRTVLEESMRPDRDAQRVQAGAGASRLPWDPITLEQAEQDPQRVFDCDAARQRQRQAVITMGESVLFDLGEADLASASSERLQRLGKLVKAHPEAQVVIMGHADKAPHPDGPTGNSRLSAARAKRVAQWLVEKGYARPQNVSSEGLGDTLPVANVNGEFRLNRRVELRVKCPQ